jgi:hypothetical protein
VLGVPDFVAAQQIADPETVAGFKRQLLDMQIIKRNEQPADLAANSAATFLPHGFRSVLRCTSRYYHFK